MSDVPAARIGFKTFRVVAGIWGGVDKGSFILSSGLSSLSWREECGLHRSTREKKGREEGGFAVNARGGEGEEGYS